MNRKNEVLEGCTIEEIEAFLKVSKAIVAKPDTIKELPISHGVRPRVQMMLRMLKTLMIEQSNTLSNVISKGGNK